MTVPSKVNKLHHPKQNIQLKPFIHYNNLKKNYIRISNTNPKTVKVSTSNKNHRTAKNYSQNFNFIKKTDMDMEQHINLEDDIELITEPINIFIDGKINYDHIVKQKIEKQSQILIDRYRMLDMYRPPANPNLED